MKYSYKVLFNHFAKLDGKRPQADISFAAHIETTLQEEDALHEGDAILDSDITPEEVAVAIRKLKSDTSSGLDKIITKNFGSIFNEVI